MESDTQFETACIDDPDFAHRGIPEKDCSWVKEQPKFRCKLKNGKRRARDYCQKSCGRCEIDMIIISKSTISISRARNSIVLLNLMSKVALAVVSARRMACPTS